MKRQPSHKSMPRTMSSTSVFGRKSDFSDTNNLMQSFRKMKTHTRFDEPGPGDYQVAGLPIPKGGRFNMSNPKSKVEWDIYRAKQLPGPADYGVPKLPGPGGGRFSTANPKSQLDWVRYFAKQMPSPADYGAPKLPKPGGGRFSEANPKTEIEWLQYFAAQMPGPSDYNPRTDKLSTQKTVPAYPMYGKVVMGNHQTGLANAIMYTHTTVNQQGPNQCRNDSAVGKQVDSLKHSQPSFSFGRSGAQPAVLNRRDVQRQLGGRLMRSNSDKYAKYFGYSPSKSKARTAHGPVLSMTVPQRRLDKAKRRPASVAASRPRRRRRGRRRSPTRRRKARATDEEIWAAEDDPEYGDAPSPSKSVDAGSGAGSGAGAGEGAGADARGDGGKVEEGEAGRAALSGDDDAYRSDDDGGGGAKRQSPTRRRRRRRRKRKARRGAKGTAQPQGMYAMLEAVRQGGRPVFSGDRSIPGVGAYDPSPSTMGFVFNSRIKSNPSFSFSNVD